MGAETEIICPQSLPLPNLDSLIISSSPSPKDKATDMAAVKKTMASSVLPFVPTIRSGSSAHIGRRRFMEDEHVRINDLSLHLASCPSPSAFFGVFDGHGGPEAAAYVRNNVNRLFFQDVHFPIASKLDVTFLQGVEDCLRRSFLLADLALADDSSISNSVGTTAITALVLGRLLLVANVGDCRAVLCRKGKPIVMSQDHRPTCLSEERRVKELGGRVDDGYLNGALSVSRALGDWDMKLPRGSASPLISEPEIRQIMLTEDDEFLIIGCDGIWDVMSSQQAVCSVRRGLRRHNDPEKSARDLVDEALRLNTTDNVTAIVVCFSSLESLRAQAVVRPSRFQCSPAFSSLRSLVEGNDSC